MELIASETPKEIRARGPLETFVSQGVTIADGEDLDVGQFLGKLTASGKYVAYDNAASDGSQTAVGILAEPCDATAGDKLAGMYTRGNFYYDQLIGGGSTAKTAAVVDLNGRLVGNELQIN